MKKFDEDENLFIALNKS